MKFLFFQKDYHGNQIYLNASSRIRIVMRKKKYLVKLPVPEYIWPDKLDQISIMKPAGVGALSEHPLREWLRG